MDKNLIPIVENFNVEEEFLYIKQYMFIKGYAEGKKLQNTLLALPIARRIHDGQYRKGLVDFNGKQYRLPYITHCLKVCSTLISLPLPITNNELDILLAAAILHDVVEDGKSKLPRGGSELVFYYGISQEVLDIVLLLSKESGASDLELNTYFNNIKKNKLALLIKLSDRSHNVEDLYNKTSEKLHKYVKETRTWIYPLTKYGKEVYPELSNAFTSLKSKIVSLTELTETVVDIYGDELKEKDKEIESLRKQLNLNKEA